MTSHLTLRQSNTCGRGATPLPLRVLPPPYRGMRVCAAAWLRQQPDFSPLDETRISARAREAGGISA